jgi:CheY-like chemotaxis protein
MELKDATVLIVDDEVDLLKIFQRWLGRQGCRVLIAEDGAEALKLATSNHVDTIVSDIRMPVMGGVELAERLRSTGNQIPKIIFVSGFSDQHEREIFDLGIEAILPKPLGRLDLLSAVLRSLTDRDALWATPPDTAAVSTLTDQFPSISEALRQGTIAFGRGGFCIRSSFTARHGQAIGLCLRFAADGHAVGGQGILRWTEPGEQQVGIEITHIDDENRAWVCDLAARNHPAPFIPRISLGLQPT